MSKSLNEMISAAVLHLMENNVPKKLSQNALAKMTGSAQSALTYNLRNETGWTVDTLDRVCTALGTSVEEVIILGRQLSAGDGGPVFPRPLKLASLPPASEARLSVIAKQAAGVTTTLASIINVQSVRDTMPDDYDDYLAGRISDGEMFVLLRKKLAFVDSECKFLAAADDAASNLLFGE